MPGAVLQVHCAPGEPVKAGDELATLESMKMEVPIISTCDGVVSAVEVDVGDAVTEGDVLVVVRPIRRGLVQS